MLTMSMGSGPGCNTQYLFSDDILGENTGHVPRHAKIYRDFAAKRRELRAEAVGAFSEFRADVADGTFPAEQHLVPLDPKVREAFDRFITDQT